MAENIIDQAFEVFRKVQREYAGEIDEASFVGGFMSCFGILTGRITIPGVAQDVPIALIFDRIQRELEDYRKQIIIKQQEQARKGG